MKRISLILALVLGTTLSFPLAARADYATFVPEEREYSHVLSPGDTVYWSAPLDIVASDDVPYIVFDGTSGFADDETVVATITLSMHQIDGLGTVELLSSPTITGTTPVDWTTGGEHPWFFTLGPPIQARFTAPSAEELGCDDHPGEDFATYMGVGGTLVGSKGTMASFAAENRRYIVDFHVVCPMAAPTSKPGAPAVTPPPTDTLPLEAASRSGWAGWLPYLVLVAGAAAVVALSLRRSSPIDMEVVNNPGGVWVPAETRHRSIDSD
jgi:hypothetical protein